MPHPRRRRAAEPAAARSEDGRARDVGLVCLGLISGAHGVRGEVRITVFADSPDAIAAYGPLSDEAGERRFEISAFRPAKGGVIAGIAGVEDRDQAFALRGTRLYVARAVLPEPEDDDSFYHADLIGLRAETPDGRTIGRVSEVRNFGAGDLLEIAREGRARSILVPFTRDFVPEVDRDGGRLVIDAPADLLGEGEAAAGRPRRRSPRARARDARAGGGE